MTKTRHKLITGSITILVSSIITLITLEQIWSDPGPVYQHLLIGGAMVGTAISTIVFILSLPPEQKQRVSVSTDWNWDDQIYNERCTAQRDFKEYEEEYEREKEPLW